MKGRTRVKICGMTRPEDVAVAVALGVDAIGMIFHPNSPRLISIEQAKKLRQAVPPFVSVVGVFGDASLAMVDQYAKELKLDFAQLHGAESPDYAAQVSIPHIKALRVKSAEQVIKTIACFDKSAAFLLDPYVKGQHGGTGQLLSDDCWPSINVPQPLLLAGGLSPENVYQRVTSLKPFAVDINSGVEDAPGKKNVELMRKTISELARADHDLSQAS